ncbi:MAG: hypothetical protein R6T98_03490 [Desulfatiglandales bacterium]
MLFYILTGALQNLTILFIQIERVGVVKVTGERMLLNLKIKLSLACGE